MVFEIDRLNFLKTKIGYKTADILDWIFTVTFTALAFWADWRIGLAFIVYDLSRVCEKVKEVLRVSEILEKHLKNNSAQEVNDGANEAPGGENQQS
jgi:hypothetical protein